MEKEKTPEGVKEKSRAALIIAGEVEPETPKERTLLNLAGARKFGDHDAERRKEIARRGAEKTNAIKGEKKTARESLERLLSIKVTDQIIDGARLSPEIAERLKEANPDATLYDLIQIVAIGNAIDGSTKAAEYVRDTAGDAPKQQIQVSNTMTEADRALLELVNDRLRAAELTVIQDQTD